MKPTLTQVIETFRVIHGFEPTGIYCLVTGKQIGNLLCNELTDLVDSLPGDAEEIVDDLAMRIYASMRPSIRWNKFRESTLDDMAKTFPVETCAYLMNRLFSTIGKSSDFTVVHGERILTYSHLASGPVDESLDALLATLLEMEAYAGLKDLSAPFTVKSMIDSSATFDAINDLLQPLLVRVRAEHARSLVEARYHKLNPSAKSALFSAVTRIKPVKEKSLTPKQQAKQERMNLFANVFAELAKEQAAPDFMEDARLTRAEAIRRFDANRTVQTAKPAPAKPSSQIPFGALKFSVKGN